MQLEQSPKQLLSIKAQDESYEFDYILGTVIPNLKFHNIRPTPLSINTMTIVCKPSTNTVRFSIQNVKPILTKKQDQGELEDGLTLSTKGLGKNCIIFKWNQKLEKRAGESDGGNKHEEKTKTETNTKTKTKTKTTRNISIKMFGNGSIHIVGITRPIEALLISNYFLNLFDDIQRDSMRSIHDDQKTRSEKASSQDIHEKNDSNIDPTCLTGGTELYSICMIQSNFEIDYAVRFKEFREHWDVTGGDIIYNKESRHPGLHIKFSELSTSCIIFTSGRILITGARKAEHLEDVYKSVTDFIDRKKEFVTQERLVLEKGPPQKRGRKRKAEHDAFYDDFDVSRELN